MRRAAFVFTYTWGIIRPFVTRYRWLMDSFGPRAHLLFTPLSEGFSVFLFFHSLFFWVVSFCRVSFQPWRLDIAAKVSDKWSLPYRAHSSGCWCFVKYGCIFCRVYVIFTLSTVWKRAWAFRLGGRERCPLEIFPMNG